MTNFTSDTEHPVIIPSNKVHLDGLLHIPQGAKGLVLFVHGSGSSRFSTRNQHVAKVLNQAKLATLLFDLLTPEEEEIDDQTRELRFDIEFLASRLIDTTHWCLKQLVTHDLKLGYFGASTGGGAALVAAAKESITVKAVVSRGGRPDLAGVSLSHVQAPTLLIVGGNDEAVIEMNESAMSKMHCVKELEIIPGATHLFEEPGTLDEVARLAKAWFVKYLGE
ncbi:MAG: dienelactone hydrolase family protein [Gammaproteobacteria bacterium]|nr:dienelactone hydrolase family protein [Gammaproteobacteria bacterium]